MQNSSALWYLAANHPALISTLLNANPDIIDPNTFFKKANNGPTSAYDYLLDTPTGRDVLDILRTKTSLLSTIEASIELANKPRKILIASVRGRGNTPLKLPSSIEPKHQKAILEKYASYHKEDHGEVGIDVFKENDESESLSARFFLGEWRSTKDNPPPAKAPKHEEGQSPGASP